MAKKEARTAASKKKVELPFKAVKLVYSTKSPKTGQWRFSEKMVKIPTGQDDIKFLEQEIKKA